MKTIVLSVEGMSCSHCESFINNAVRSLAGVKKVKASRRKKSVTVSFDETVLSEEVIAAAINETGYQVIS